MTADPRIAVTSTDGDGQPAKQPLPKPVPTTLRRRGAAVAIGLTIVIVGALAFLNVLSRFSETVAVIRIDDDIPRGDVIARDDLATANIVTDPGLETIPAERIDDVVGLRASTDLVEGTLLSEASLTSTMVPGIGERLVGVAVQPSQLPGEPLMPGDVIHVVRTPSDGGELSGEPPTAVEATVLQTYEPGADGKSVIDVLVPNDDAFWLAALVATEDIAIVLDSREQ